MRSLAATLPPRPSAVQGTSVGKAAAAPIAAAALRMNWRRLNLCACADLMSYLLLKNNRLITNSKSSQKNHVPAHRDRRNYLRILSYLTSAYKIFKGNLLRRIFISRSVIPYGFPRFYYFT
jgi:hypothetical protein